MINMCFDEIMHLLLAEKEKVENQFCSIAFKCDVQTSLDESLPW